MNELTSGEPLQRILERRERAAALSAVADIATRLVAWTLAIALALSLAASALAIDPSTIGKDTPPISLEGFTYSP